MEVTVDQTSASLELEGALQRARENPDITACTIKPAIDFILTGKNCLTYRYILLTALVAKATNNDVDILSLQASDASDGAYDARSLCSHVIFPFQREFLDDVLDGSNEDPLVNNPGRHPRLDKDNKAAAGDPHCALDLLCDYLPRVRTSDEARDCLDYFMARCMDMAEAKQQQAQAFDVAAVRTDVFGARDFMSELLDKNFGGTALLLVASTVFSALYRPEDGYEVIAHPVNQSGASKRQMSDLDIFNAEGSPFLAVELKDKPFTETEVKKAAKTAFEHHAPAMLFIAGRDSSLAESAYRYFNEIKAAYEEEGMMIGVMTIDALLDFFFTTNYSADTTFMFDVIRGTMEDAHAVPEAIRWVCRRMTELDESRS